MYILIFSLLSICTCRAVDPPRLQIVGSLSKDVFERRTSTGSEAFSLFICLDANKFVLLSFFSLIKTIYQRVSTKPLSNDAKSPLPVDVRRSKTQLLKLPIENWWGVGDIWRWRHNAGHMTSYFGLKKARKRCCFNCNIWPNWFTSHQSHYCLYYNGIPEFVRKRS